MAKDPNGEVQPLKKARHEKANVVPEPDLLSRVREGITSSQDDHFYVPPERSRRNGMVFEDITLRSLNIPKSNTLPNRKRVIHLSDLDFTKPIPEWMTSGFVQTAGDSQFSTIDVHVPISTTNAALHTPDRNTKVIDFVTVQELCSLQETTTSSLSALPSRPGFLRETLFTHIMGSLSTLITRAENGLKQSWGTARIRVPAHFVDAITFVTSASKMLAKALTAESPEQGDIADLSVVFVEVVNFVVQTANVVDAMDLLNLINNSMRVKYATRLTRTLDILITVTTNLTVDRVTTLQMIAESLNSSVPASLLPSRFRVHEAIIDCHFELAIYRLTTESMVFKSTLDTVDRIRPIVKRVGKQLDRIAAEERINNDTYRQILQHTDLKREMLNTFLDALSTNKLKTSFMCFKMASELAKLAGEKYVQAECLYRMANISIMRGKSYGGVTPNTLLVSARALNLSDAFQSKVQSLLTSVRRRTMSSLLDLASNVNRESDLVAFIDGVKLFIHVLLARYPSEGIDANTVLQGDTVKGLLKIIRVFHPDKNSSADEEARWICEEITKVLSSLVSANL